MTVLASRDSEAVGMQTHVTQSAEEGSAVYRCARSAGGSGGDGRDWHRRVPILKDACTWGASQELKEGVTVPGGPGVLELVREGRKGRGDEPDGEGSLVHLTLQGVTRDDRGGWGCHGEVRYHDGPERALEEAENKRDGRCGKGWAPGEQSERQQSPRGGEARASSFCRCLRGGWG